MYITENDKAMIRQLIEKQLQAFQENDHQTAYSLTSPSIRKKFAQSDFIKMMESKYNALINPRSIMFRGFTLIDNFPALVSTILDQDGSLLQAIFVAQHQQDYSWLIHGYELVSINEKII